MIRLLLVLVVAALALVGGAPDRALSQAGSGAIVKFSPPNSHKTLSETGFTVDVTVENVVTTNPCEPWSSTEACGMGSYGFTVSFDPAVIQWVDTVDGGFTTSTDRSLYGCFDSFGHDPLNGKIAWSCSTQSNNPPDPQPFGPDGAGVLATITFNPVADGLTNLVFEQTELAEVDGVTSIAHCAEDGTVAIADSAGLWVTKSGPCEVTAPTNVTYTVEVTNLGPDTASDVVVVDTLPADVDFSSVTPPPPQCTYVAPPTHQVTCSFASILASQSATAEITVIVAAADAGKTIVNAVDVSSSTADPVTLDDHAELSRVVDPSDVDIVKTAPGQIAMGALGQYQIVVTSNGPSAAAAVSVTDPLPTDVVHNSTVTDVGSCDYSAPTHTVNCNLNDMGSGTVATITIDVTFPNEDTYVTNQATVAWTAAQPEIRQSQAKTTMVGYPDTDGDGCVDFDESGIGGTGGMGFNRLDRWDVYDVPIPANPDPTSSGPKNRVVDIGDALAVLFYAFASPGSGPNGNGVDYDSVKDGDWNGVDGMFPDGVVDTFDRVGLRYDRDPSPEPNPPWNAGSPNGIVDIGDALAALQQFGINCSTLP